MAENKKTQANVNDALNNSTLAAENPSDSSLEMYLLNLAKKESAQLASSDKLSKAEKFLMDTYYTAKFKHIEETSASEEEKAKRTADLKNKLNAKIVEMAQKMEENAYKFSSKREKIKIKESQKSILDTTKTEIKAKMTVVASEESHGNHKNAELKKLRAAYLKSGQEQITIERQKRKLENEAFNEQLQHGIVRKGDLDEYKASISASYEVERQGHLENVSFLNEQIALLEEKKKKSKGKDAEDGGKIDQEIEELKGKQKEEKKAANKADKERFGDELLANTMKAGFQGMENGLNVLGDKFSAAMDNAVEQVGQYKSVFDARLQGTQSSYDSVAKTLKQSLAASAIVKQTEVLKKLNDALDKGIAYNAEQRAFLATMTDKIVATFDAFDANLLRIIRLQQADTTAARMGMESNLLQFFNSTFSDNSYLAEGYDNVSQTLVDANAQMTRDQSISFEYNVQKWMGSLASLGFSTETINTIAQGINYLGSGNVAALAGNTQLQNLMAMSASRAGLSYSDLLVKGIDDSSVNDLLKSMVEYLAEIAEDENAVVKAAYGDVFNFTQADLRAIKNISSDKGATIANIYNQSMSYSNAMSEIQNQLNSVSSRLSMNEKIDNVIDNFLYSAGESLASNAATALTWRILNTIEEVTGGIEIPFINVYGFGLDLNMSVEKLIKTGMFGLSAIGQIGNMVSSIQSGGGADLSIWGGTEYTQRGKGFTSTVGGVQSSTSQTTTTVTSSASSDTKKEAQDSTKEDQEEQKKQSKESMEDEIMLEDLYKELFEIKTPIYTIDVPVKENTTKIVEATAAISTSTSNINTTLNNLYTLLTDPTADGMKVYVTNIAGAQSNIDIPDSTSISNVNALAEAIANKILGLDASGNNDTSKATLADIANLLAYGTIRVIDHQTAQQLTELNMNLI